MNIVCFKRVGRWPFEKLADAVVYLLNLWVKLRSPKLKVKKKNKPDTLTSKIKNGYEKQTD